MSNNVFNSGKWMDKIAPLETVFQFASDLSEYFLQENMVDWFEFDSEEVDHPKIKISPWTIHRIVFEGKSSEYSVSAQSDGKLITIHTVTGEKYTRSIGLTEFLRETEKRKLKGLFVQVSKSCALGLFWAYSGNNSYGRQKDEKLSLGFIIILTGVGFIAASTKNKLTFASAGGDIFVDADKLTASSDWLQAVSQAREAVVPHKGS